MHALRQIADRGAEGGDDADLLLEQMEEIGLRPMPLVEPQVTSLPPRFRESRLPAQVSGPTCSNTTSTPFLAVRRRAPGLEAVFTVVQHMVGAQRP